MWFEFFLPYHKDFLQRTNFFLKTTHPEEKSINMLFYQFQTCFIYNANLQTEIHLDQPQIERNSIRNCRQSFETRRMENFKNASDYFCTWFSIDILGFQVPGLAKELKSMNWIWQTHLDHPNSQGVVRREVRQTNQQVSKLLLEYKVKAGDPSEEYCAPYTFTAGCSFLQNWGLEAKSICNWLVLGHAILILASR